MAGTPFVKRKYDATVARIAGNLLSGFPFDEYGYQDTIRLIREAVAMARAIVAEVERTEPVPTAKSPRETWDAERETWGKP